MLIGILSDSHDQVETTRSAIGALRDAGAQFFIHCGDVGGEAILDQLAGLPAVFVWGNNDWDRKYLAQYAADLGIDCRGDFAELELDRKRIAVTHGDHSQLMRSAMEPGKFDYLFHGHTHIPTDERLGSLRIINPGALHRARQKTVATLDTAADVVRFIELNVKLR